MDVSALYFIASPKTPEPVRKEVIARAQSGEPMTKAKAVEVLESYKAKEEAPTPAVARQIAIATGLPTASTDNVFVLPMSKRDEEALAREQNKIRNIYNAIEVIAKECQGRKEPSTETTDLQTWRRPKWCRWETNTLPPPGKAMTRLFG